MKKRRILFLALAIGVMWLLYRCSGTEDEEGILQQIYYTARAELYMKYGDSMLDRTKLDTDTTTREERVEYYSDRVDSLELYMINELQDDFYVKLFICYKNEEDFNNDMIYLLRNDNVATGFVEGNEQSIITKPGIYEVWSSEYDKNDGLLGEIEILKFGQNYDLIIDYEKGTAEIQE